MEKSLGSIFTYSSFHLQTACSYKRKILQDVEIVVILTSRYVSLDKRVTEHGVSFVA